MPPLLAPAPNQASAQENAEQTLRAHLMAQGIHNPPQRTHAGLQDPGGNPALHHQVIQNIDPAIAGNGSMMSHSAGESGGEDGGEGRKGKRELSTSKRAAQNRAAQRAFRQRKEGHIKKLEEQVRDYNALNENYKTVQAENYLLRDYIINLQSRLLESQGDFPQPPGNIALQNPRPGGGNGGVGAAPTAPMASSAMSQLQAVAADGQRVVSPYDRRLDVQMQGTTDPQLAASNAPTATSA